MLVEIPREREREVMGVGEGEVMAEEAAVVAVEVVLMPAGMATRSVTRVTSNASSAMAMVTTPTDALVRRRRRRHIMPK
jgi:hypothetical protein